MSKKYLSLEHAIRNAVRDQQYKKKPLNEDFEFEMARNELRTAIDAAKRLLSHMDGEGELEAWVQSKITKGADYLDTVADYMDHKDSKKLKEHTEEIMETLDAVGNDRKKQANVGRLNTPASHNKKVQVRTKIIDEAKSLKNVVKSIIKDKKEEKESGAANPLVDFDPKLRKVTDGAMVKEELGLAPGIAGSGWDPAELAKLKAANDAKNKAKLKPGVQPPAPTENEKTPAPADLKVGQSVPNSGAEKNQAAVDDVGSRLRGGRKIEMPDDETIANRNEIGKAAMKTMASFTPAGLPIAAHDAYQNIKQGNYKDAAIDALGALPFAGRFIKGASSAARVARAGTNVVAPAAAVGGALASSDAAADEKKPQEGQAEVQTPTVTTSSPPPVPTPPKPAETPKPAVPVSPAPSSSAAPKPAAPVKPQKYTGTISQFQKEHPGATVGQAMNAIQGKTAIAGGKNDVAVIAKTRKVVYDPNAEKPTAEPHPNATQNTSNSLPSQDQPPAPAKIEKDSPAPPKQNDELELPKFQSGAEDGGKTKKKVNESALINAFIQYYKNYK